MDDNYSNEFKIILLGDSKVGKTSFFRKLTTGEFNVDETITLSINRKTIQTKMEHDKEVIISIFDTPGIYRLRSTVERLYDIIDGIILIYDNYSFENSQEWIDVLKEVILDDIPILLLKNEKQLETNKDIISKEEKFAEEKGFKFDGCSIKNDSQENLLSIFNKFAKYVFENSPVKKREKERKKKILEEERMKKAKKEEIIKKVSEENKAEKNLYVLLKYFSF